MTFTENTNKNTEKYKKSRIIQKIEKNTKWRQ